MKFIIFSLVLIIPSSGYGIANTQTIYTCTNLKASSIKFPSVLTSHKHSLSFKLTVQKLKCSGFGLKVSASINLRRLGLKLSNIRSNSVADDLSFQHFLADGSVLAGNLYYSKSEYCIKRIEKDSIALNLCKIHCDTQTLCIPKCCDLDKIIDLDGKSCVYTGTSEWKPIVHDFPNSTRPSVNSQSRIRLNPINCTSESPAEYLNNTATKRSGFQTAQFRILRNGSALHWLNDTSSGWSLLSPNSYCIDAAQSVKNWKYNNNFEAFLRTCPSFVRVSTNGSMTTAEESVLIPAFYGLVMVISCGLLTTTLVVYLLLRKKQKFHMWVLTSYIVSLLLLNIFFGVSNLITQVSTVMKRKERMTGSVGCIVVGCAAHLFLLSTFGWLTMTNLNLWFTFRTKVIERHGMKRFSIYSLFCWGIPVVLVGLGNVLDHMNRNGYPKLLSPNYGKGRCLISVPAEGLYIFFPVGALLIFNILLIISTFRMFKTRQVPIRNLNGKSNDKQLRLMKIHVMLFLIATSQWTIEILAWYFRWDTGQWYWILIVLATLFQSLIICVVFVCGRNALANLGGRFSLIKRASTYFSRRHNREKEAESLLVPKSKDNQRSNSN